MSSSRKRPGKSPLRPPPAAETPQGERLQKVLAAAGIASRRAAEEMIVAGRVRVDGRIVTMLGTRIDPSSAQVEVDGKRIATHPGYDYLALNKPAGVVTTARDPQGRRTVMDLVESERRLFPVGRLDIDTTGLVLLTNHGELAHRLAHPKYRIERVYVARVAGTPSPQVLERLRRGVKLEDGTARARAVSVKARGARHTQLEITMTEGRKREVRRMLTAVDYPVEQLARTSFGPVRLGRLGLGHARRLRPDEVGELLRIVGL